MFSATLRDILRERFGVEVGRYSYGPCLHPGFLPRGTRVGNYCSFAAGILIFRRNHPLDRLSQHPFFFNERCGILEAGAIPGDSANPLEVGHDVWIGARSVILPNCRSIGTGAVIGAGAVVTRDVPAFGVVGGNPARRIGERFTPEVEAAVVSSEWWLKPLPEVLEQLPVFLQSLNEAGPEVLRCLALRSAPGGARDAHESGT